MKTPICTALCALFLAVGCAPHTIVLESPQAKGLAVRGEGEATQAPDLATVRVGVEERAVSAQAALAQANETMRRVMEAVKAEGVDGKDLQTADLSMYFERDPHVMPQPVPPQPIAPPRTGAADPAPSKVATEQVAGGESSERAPAVDGVYVVRNTAVIALRDLDKVGTVIGSAMNAGANTLYGFELSIEDPTQLQNEAREDAIEAALEKARRMADRAGVKLGAVVSIQESQSSPPMPYAAGRMALEKAQANVPVERGQLTVVQTVEVTFTLAD